MSWDLSIWDTVALACQHIALWSWSATQLPSQTALIRCPMQLLQWLFRDIHLIDGHFAVFVATYVIAAHTTAV